VGFLPEDARFIPDEGTHLVAAASLPRFEGVSPSIGHVTSSYMSAALGCSFGLALIADGARRIGETVYCVAGDRCLPVRLVDSVLYDKAGGRRDGDA
jgi:sarcosine oxidase subunit alpha